MAELGTVAREGTRIGLTGFGGPPAHIALLRKLAVDREGWMDHDEFEDANAACSLLPGPSSTQLAIFCAYRVAGWPGAIVGGLGFIVPAVGMVLALSVVFLSGAPPDWIRGAGAGAGGARPCPPRPPPAPAPMVAPCSGGAPAGWGAGSPRRRSDPGWSSSCSA